MGYTRVLKAARTFYFITVLLIVFVEGITAGEYITLLLQMNWVALRPNDVALKFRSQFFSGFLHAANRFVHLRFTTLPLSYFSDEEQHGNDRPALKVQALF